jgi:SAM-dependent methyltransferase
MPKQDECAYLSRIGPEAVRYALAKPFSDPDCGRFLIQLGTIMSFLPRPPARLLDLGCGTGWTSDFFARQGYEVLGLDIAADMIVQARVRDEAEGLPNLQFQVGDYEEMEFAEEFDAVVFFASLHHAMDEEEALGRVHRALRPQGVCITCEPGRGHSQTAAAREAVDCYGVTEKDMPPARIMELGKKVGFQRCRLVPEPLDCSLVVASIASPPGSFFKRLVESSTFASHLLWLRRLWRFRRELPYHSGIVVLEKD